MGFGISDFRFQISDFRFQISDFRFQISDFRFQISDFRFQISDFRFQIGHVKTRRGKARLNRGDLLESAGGVSSIAFIASFAAVAVGGRLLGSGRERKALDHFVGEFAVGDGAGAEGIVFEDGLAEAGGLAEADGAGDDRFEDEGGEMFADFLGDLAGEVGAHVVHSQENAADVEAIVDAGLFELLDHAENLAEAFHGEIFALEGDEEIIRRGEAVHRDEAEGGRAVEDDGAEALGVHQGAKDFAELDEVIVFLAELDFDGGEVNFGGDEKKIFLAGGENLVGGGAFAVKGAVKAAAGFLVKAEAAGGVGLGVEVYKEGRDTAAGEAEGEVDRRGGFADAAFLVGNGENSGRHDVTASWGKAAGSRD